MLVYSWADVYDAGSTINQHWIQRDVLATCRATFLFVKDKITIM